jgi:3-keto steroid reductase
MSVLTSSSKILWSSSLEANKSSIYNPQDPSGKHSKHTYASSKRFIEILHYHLIRQTHKPLFFLTHPGITDSSVVAPYEFPLREILQHLKTISFYIARFCGSPWHSISGRNGACSMIYCALVCGKEDELVKWGSGSDWWGRERLLGTSLETDAKEFEKEAFEAFRFI